VAEELVRSDGEARVSCISFVAEAKLLEGYRCLSVEIITTRTRSTTSSTFGIAKETQAVCSSAARCPRSHLA
jgi:hypothetical protein